MPTPSITIPPYKVKIRDENLNKIGELDRLSSMTLKPSYLGVGAFELTIPAGQTKAALLRPGGWVQFSSGENEIMAGQIRGLELIENESNVGGTIKAYGPSAEQVLADRLAYQVPTSAATAQSGPAYDSRSGTAETIIKQYVDLNAGPGALAARRTTGFVVQADSARGTSVKGTARMTNLLDLIAPLAQSGGIGFRVVFNGDQLEFQVYEPLDRSGTAKFGMGLGNLIEYTYTREAAKTNCAVVGGQGDLTARVFREINDTAAQTAWANRSESFVDRRDSTDLVELDQAGTEEVATNGPVTGLSIKTADTPNLQFYQHYFLGDIVSIPERGITDILRELEIEWSADKAPTTTSTVGTASTTGTLSMLAQLDALNDKVAKLEARK